jgi:hypothetical protein
MKSNTATIKNYFEKAMNGIAGYVKRNYIGKIKCAHCQQEAIAFTFKKTSDKMPICKSCREKLPYDTGTRIREIGFADLSQTLGYLDYSQKVLAPKFQNNFPFKDFEADTVNGLIKINSTVLEMKRLQSHALVFKATEGKDGLFKSKVKGDIYANFTTDIPELNFDNIVTMDVWAKAKYKRLSNVFFYETPELDAYNEQLAEMIQAFKN